MDQPTPQASISQARDERTNLKADLVHGMILNAIATEDITMLRLLLEEPYNAQNLTVYLICAAIQNVASIREILCHMGPVRDGCVMYTILNAKHIPSDCFDELMCTVVPDLSEQ